MTERPEAVADASPLIVLAAVGRLDLLRKRFGRIVIPPAVYEEVVTRGRGRFGSSEVAEQGWIETVPLPEPEAARDIRERLKLDRGEAEAIALCAGLGARRLFLDDRRGREAAEALGIRVVGTAGFIVEAEERGLLEDAAALLDAAERAGLYLAASVRNEALARLRRSRPRR